MKFLSLVLYVTLHSALSHTESCVNPPAPVNVSVKSYNFHHVLRWDPGPSTPPGTLYKIYKWVNGKTEQLHSTKTSLELLLDNHERCSLVVEAYNNQSCSKESKKVFFTPYEDTKIGPAELSLVGCGTCIQINITLPKPDQRSGVTDIQKFYDPQFLILWRKEKTLQTQSFRKQKSFTLTDLEAGEKYCVQVKPEIRTNKNTLASAWKCTYTSIVDPPRDLFVLGAVAALLIVVVGVLMGSVFCLNYTGFLCKLQATLPSALITALSRGYMLTPEKTIPDLISITSDMQQEQAHNNPPSHTVTYDSNSEEEEEEEGEGNILYMDRNAELSSGESSCSSTNASGNCKVATSENSGGLPSSAHEFESGVVQSELHQDDVKAEGATVCFILEEVKTGVQGHVKGEQEDEETNTKVEACDSSGNVNLFSVTIAALAAGEKEEEENTRHSLKPSDSVSDLLPQVSNLTLNNPNSQMTESDDQTTVVLMHHNETGYEGRHAHIQEEEKEFSEYMAHT